MNRRDLIKLLGVGISPAAFPQQLSDPLHPPVNLDVHGEDMPSGMDMASDNFVRSRALGVANQARAVLTRSGGDLRHGVYQDTIFTPDRLVKNPPRKLFSVELPGDARGLEGQPLIVPGVKMASGYTRDLLLSATMSNHVYAHDARDGTPLWMTWLGVPIDGSPKIDGHLINDHWGILSTGQIDGTLLYVVSWTSQDGTAANGQHRLHAIDLTRGIQAKPPLALSQETTTMQRKQRASLSLMGRTLYIPWGTIQETAKGAHGFVTAVDVDTWKVTGELNLTPTGSGAGIWMAGQGMSSNGAYLYAMTGNGDYDGVQNFGECFIKFDKNLRVVDQWSPFRDSVRAPTDQDKLRGNGDMDLGAGGCIYIPESDLVVGAGKDGILYVLRASNMKAGPITAPTFITFNGMGIDPTPANLYDLNTVMARTDRRTHHMHSTPVYWQGKLYVWGENGNGRVNSIDKNGKVQFLARTAEISSPYAPAIPGGMPGSMMCLSANGDKDGVLWAIVPDGDANRTVTTGRLFAFHAQDFTDRLPDGDLQIRRLWMSDPHHVYNKFLPPVISNGIAYVGTYDRRVEAWG